MLQYVTWRKFMKKVSKYLYIGLSIILTIFTGIIAIVAGVKVTRLIRSINYISEVEDIPNIPRYDIFIIVFVIIFLLLFIVSSVIYFSCVNKDPKNNYNYQVISLLICCGGFVTIFIFYSIIKLKGIFAVFNDLADDIGLSTTPDAVYGDEISYIKNLLFGDLFLCCLCFSLLCLVTSILFVCYSRSNQKDNLNSDNNQTPINNEVPKTANDQIKQEIESMKQQLEFQKLKDEYASLYKQINYKSDQE